MYRVEAARTRVKRELKRIPKSELARIAEAVGALATNPYPSGSEQLQPGIFRVRIGSYRIIYKVFEDEDLILIGRIARRSEKTYRQIDTLFD